MLLLVRAPIEVDLILQTLTRSSHLLSRSALSAESIAMVLEVLQGEELLVRHWVEQLELTLLKLDLDVHHLMLELFTGKNAYLFARRAVSLIREAALPAVARSITAYCASGRLCITFLP